MSGDTRMATRGDDRVVVELDCGVVVYPARQEGERWRAVWYENGRRRQCESVSEDRLAGKLEKVTARLAADAPNTERLGADLIAFYLSRSVTRLGRAGRVSTPTPSGGSASGTWPRSSATWHVRTSRPATCRKRSTPPPPRGRRPAPPVHLRPGLGRVPDHPRLNLVHWQPGEDQPAPAQAVTVAGESALFVDPSEIPASADVAKLGQALAYLDQVYELMANFTAYTGLRWGELAALTHTQITPAVRTVDVDRKIIEIGGLPTWRGWPPW